MKTPQHVEWLDFDISFLVDQHPTLPKEKFLAESPEVGICLD